MFIKIKDSSDGNRSIRWIVDTESMNIWGLNGFQAKGYYVQANGSVVEDSLKFRWNEPGLSFESYNDLESAKLACYGELGYKPVKVKDMKPGDVFSVMYNNIETKCSKFKYINNTYILVMEGYKGGVLDPSFITEDTLVCKQYKLEEVNK